MKTETDKNPTNHENKDSTTEEYQIKVVTQDMVEKAMDFAWKYFYPDEPLFRSLGTRRGSAASSFMKPYLGKGQSLVAVDPDGNLLALRAGKIVNADSRIERFFEESNVVMSLLIAFAKYSGQIPKADLALPIIDRLGYYPYKLMDRTGAKKIYGALCICTSSAARGKGLGTRLVAESIKLARDQGCEYMYVLVTGNYSAKIFDKLGFSVENELIYSEYVDSEGSPLLKDTREHIKAQVRLLKL